MYTLTIKLKQHTPLIHFQHDQEGATLRASEVKPKLDKYILSLLTPEEKAQGEREGWIKSKDVRTWLDYKMKIETSEPRDVSMTVVEEVDRRNQGQKSDNIGRPLYKTQNYPDNLNSLIMGNMGGRIREDVLNFVMFDNISLTIIFNCEWLFTKVKDEIFDFFFVTNFGNRTSKGFGSFIAYSINDEKCKIAPICDWLASFTLTTDEGRRISERKAMKDIFIVINKIWKELKTYSRVPKGTIKSVFLNVPSKLTNNEDRIPSPVYFKPRIKLRSENKWEVIIYIFLNIDVVSAAGADEDAFYTLIDRAIEGKSLLNTFNTLRLSNSISNFKIQSVQ